MALDPRQFESVVLIEIVELYPDQLTPDELVLRLSGGRDERQELMDAIRKLKGSGLLEYNGDAVAATGAALHAAELFTL
jgi:hypothetical protein